MKKKLFRIAALGLCLCTALASVGCGKRIKNDPNAKVIVVSVYNGGLGTEWIDPIAEKFEADFPGYDVQIERLKRTVEEIDNLISLGNQADMYISTVSDFHKQIYAGELEDLSDVLLMKPDGGNGLTVGEKMNDLEKWKKIASKDGEGIYMLPYDDSVLGLNYDHGKFVEAGLMIEAAADETTKAALAEQGITFTEQAGKLVFTSSENETNYKTGDVILRAGKDNKFGTYDDGQPITIAEWNTLVNTLKGLGKAFIYSGKIVDYTTDVFNGIFAQYDGLNAWDTFNSYTGDYTFEGDGEPTEITLETGYKVFGMTGIKKATEFLQNYLNNRDYVHGSAFMSEESHTDAQGKFVLGSAKPSVDAPFTGMLVDGSWWEREANGIFRDLSADSRYKDYAYGNRDYRIMLYPEMEGQKALDREGNVNNKGTVLSARSTGACVIPKQDNRDIVEKTKIFLSYTLKDEYLRSFTVKTGGIRPYKYELSAEDRQNVTKYTKNIWDMYHDTENIGIVRPLLDRYVTAVPYKTSKGIQVNWMSKVGTVSYNMPINALRQAGNNGQNSTEAINTVFNGFQAHFEPAWPNFMNELKR